MAKREFRYDVKEIYEDTYLVNEYYSSMFVLIGSERALVIDCGTGVGDFKSVIESLTDKPFDVAVTHSHVDHIGGRGQFEEIFVSEKDAEYIQSVNTFQRMGYTEITKLSLNTHFYGIRIDKIKKEPKVKFIKEGDVFELGGRSVAVYETPGHTVGSVSFLDEKNGVLFVGDVANEFLFMWLPHCTSLETMVMTHEKIIALDGFDTVWSSHHTEPQTKSDIEKYRQGALEVINGQKRNAVFSVIKVHDYNGAKLIYRTGNVHAKR